METGKHKSKPSRWTPQKVCRLMENIKNHPCVWNPSNKNYLNREKCEPVYITLRDQFPPDTSESSITEKIQEFRTLYIQQLYAIKEDPEAPIKISWFKDAQFLSDGLTDEEIHNSQKKFKSLPPKICRACLGTNKPNVIEPLEHNEYLVKLYEELTGFKVIFNRQQYLPIHLCMVCGTSVLDCQAFLELSKRSENILQKVYECEDNDTAMQLLTGIKVEEEDVLGTYMTNLVEVKYFDLMDGMEESSSATGSQQPTELVKSNIKKEVDAEPLRAKSSAKHSKRHPQTDDDESDGFVEEPIVYTKKVYKTKKKKLQAAGVPPIKVSSDSICPYCGKTIKINGRYHHFQICSMNPDANPRLFECDMCHSKYKRKYSLLSHIQMFHQNIIPQIKCPHCDEVFKRFTDRLCHVRSKHMIKQPFQCQLCNKGFDMKFRLTNHIRSTHTKETPFACHLCDMSKSTKKALGVHIRMVHSTNPVYCSVCGKEFKHSKYLKQHMLVHTGEKNYKCPVCEQRFAQNHVLRAHVLKLHPGYELPPKGTVLSERGLPTMLAFQEKQAKYVKF